MNQNHCSTINIYKYMQVDMSLLSTPCSEQFPNQIRLDTYLIPIFIKYLLTAYNI